MIPTRLLVERPELLVSEVDEWFEKLKPIEDNAALNFANALLNLLWAFELRATASWVFQIAIKRGIFSRDVFRSDPVLLMSVCFGELVPVLVNTCLVQTLRCLAVTLMIGFDLQGGGQGLGC